MRPHLTLIRGLPGSGKSTLAKTLSAVHLEADMYFVNPQGEYHFRPEHLAQAHEWCQQQTEYWLQQGKDVWYRILLFGIGRWRYTENLPDNIELS